MGNHRPILVLAASAGTGHTIAARAVAEALRQQAPDEMIEVLDILDYGGTLFRQLYGRGYDALVRLLPEAWGWFYYTTDKPRSHPGHRLLHDVQNLLIGPMLRHLIRLRPKLVVNTHFLAAELIAMARQRRALDCPQATALTDFEGHRLWVQNPTERYYVATERARAYLVACGAAAATIRVTGIPLAKGFGVDVEPRELRWQLGLNPDLPVVLLLGSAGGVGPAVEFLQQLIALPCEAQLVAITGNFEKVRRRFDELAQRTSRPVKVLGFTNEMHRWMRAADLVVTKPGGLTIAEALAAQLPIVIINPLAGQELCNSDYVLEHGAAVKVNKPELLAYEVKNLLCSPERRQAMRTAARALARPHAAEEIAADALNLLNT